MLSVAPAFKIGVRLAGAVAVRARATHGVKASMTSV
jgi:hypothetical protein